MVTGAGNGCEFLGHGGLRDRNKDRNITTKRNVDAQRFSAALGGEVLSQTFAQLASVVANDIVFNGAIAGQAVKYLHADLVLGDLALTAFEGFCNHKQQEL